MERCYGRSLGVHVLCQECPALRGRSTIVRILKTYGGLPGPVLRKNVKRVSEIGSRSQRDEAILVVKSADDRFRQNGMAVSNPVPAHRRCFAI